MARSESTDVLVVGAGPVGLTLAGELRRAGVACRIVDRLPARLPYARAVGIQPRTLELFDRMGLVREVLDAAVPMRGQVTYVDGAERGRVELVLPPEVPYGFAALPQYETERLLEEFLGRYGTGIERSTALVAFARDAAGVTSRLTTASGAEEEVRSRYLVGCDGAHSTVRKGLGLSFEGGAFPEEYMLADVEVDWALPSGYGVRSMRLGAGGAVDDLLVCVPLPGRGRYRMSMPAPPELSAARRAEAVGPAGGDGVAHGLEGGAAPGLADVQRVLDRLAPEPATASALRWSSVFGISHRLVDRYGEGRVFVAGDAAHIHPPTGAQGMNTGVQDAANLAWKLALAVGGAAGRGCSRVTTPSAARWARRSSGEPSGTPPKASRPTRRTRGRCCCARPNCSSPTGTARWSHPCPGTTAAAPGRATGPRTAAASPGTSPRTRNGCST